jgi:hypothetical protein
VGMQVLLQAGEPRERARSDGGGRREELSSRRCESVGVEDLCFLWLLICECDLVTVFDTKRLQGRCEFGVHRAEGRWAVRGRARGARMRRGGDSSTVASPHGSPMVIPRSRPLLHTPQDGFSTTFLAGSRLLDTDAGDTSKSHTWSKRSRL